jgi:CRISPR-associated protein Cas5t
MLGLYLESPFAACRTFTAGWFRPTATFLTPSAAYGLLLNVAGIESRLREEDNSHDGKTPASYIRPGLPACKIALGVPIWAESGSAFPRMQTIYQQLHNYPVGAAGKERAEDAKGNKYNITPVRREFLSELRAVVLLQASEVLEHLIRRGLRGETDIPRYGLPFLGDNQFLIDRLEEVSWPWSGKNSPKSIRWYEILGADSTTPRERATRMTITIDRADLSRTKTALYAPGENCDPATMPSSAAWTSIESP